LRPLNTFDDIILFSKRVGINTAESPLQPQYACLPTSATEWGIANAISDLQFKKATSPMVCKFSGKLISSKA
jgi:hypothetical protein